METSNNSRPDSYINKIITAAYLYAIITTLSLLFISFFSSCKKEEFDFEHYAGSKAHAQWGIPLVHGKLSVLDMLNDTAHVNLSGNNMITLVYSSEMSTPELGDLIRIPDLEFSNTYNFSMPEYVPANDSVFIPYSQFMELGPGDGLRIDSLRLSSCMIGLELSTSLNRDARIKIKIPMAIKNGIPYESEVFYHWKDNQSASIVKNIDLSDYLLGLKSSGGISGNLEVLFDVTVFNNANPDLSPYKLDVHQHISDVAFGKFSGYIGSLTIPFESTSIPLDVFKNRISGNIDFSEPRISFRAENSIGAPVQINFVSIRSYFAGHPEASVAVSGNFEDEAWIIAPPNNGQSVKSNFSTYDISSANSNLRDVLFGLPDRISLAAKAITNPEGANGDNFFYDVSRLAMTMDVELPLHGIADKLVLEDSYKFNFDDLENLKSAEFKLNLKNGFPLMAGLQVYFADDEFMLIDSLYSTPLMVEAGTTDPLTMQVVTPSKASVSNVFDEARFDRIKYETRNIMLRSMLDTPGGEAIKIFANNYLDVQIGALYTKY